VKSTGMHKPAYRPGYPNGRYPLVGERGQWHAARVRKPTQRHFALTKLGFPANWFVPPELAIDWRCSLFPLKPTAAATRQWREAMLEMVYIFIGSFENEALAKEKRADIENDLDLLGRMGSKESPGRSSATHNTQRRLGAPLKYPKALKKGIELWKTSDKKDRTIYRECKEEFGETEQLPGKIESFMRNVRAHGRKRRQSKNAKTGRN
jgi:hypothetical protein